MPDFFETVKRGIEKGVATVGAKSKEMLEVSQLRSQIRSLETERRGRLEELGNIVHVMLTRGKLDEARLQEKSSAIATLEAGLKAREEQIRAIQLKTEEIMGTAGPQRIGQCICGADLLEGAKFCGGCGKPVTPSLAAPDVGERESSGQCPRCGHATAPGAPFCAGCGSPMGRAGA